MVIVNQKYSAKNIALQSNNLISTVKRSGDLVVMVWRCMLVNGVWKLQFVKTNMNQFVYFGILKSSLDKSATNLGLSDVWSFHLDNNLKHTSRILKKQLFSIQNLCGELKHLIRQKTTEVNGTKYRQKQQKNLYFPWVIG